MEDRCPVCRRKREPRDSCPCGYHFETRDPSRAIERLAKLRGSYRKAFAVAGAGLVIAPIAALLAPHAAVAAFVLVVCILGVPPLTLVAGIGYLGVSAEERNARRLTELPVARLVASSDHAASPASDSSNEVVASSHDSGDLETQKG